MREALEEENYYKAYRCALELRSLDYTVYKREINNCIDQCANAGVVDALIYMAEKYTQKGNGSVNPKAFSYLKALSDKGYINSFRPLGDCYYYGLGCEKDLRAAKKSYFEAYMFSRNPYDRDVFKN